ncbi:MAG: hypothetical protein Q8L87_03095 [Anaerolineales bacterium]|nr:hypothetical protein [Anaerolineales bacterium]
MAGKLNFQWQNDNLCKTIYPMRLQKLRDFLVFYREVDLWAEYKNKNISTLTADVKAYESGLELARQTEFKKYSHLKNYFMTDNVRGHFVKYKPMDEAELAEIQKVHQLFISSWPRDIRGERSFIKMRIDSWANHIRLLKDWIKSRQRRLAAMVIDHPKYAPETEELRLKENASLPMALDEMDKLRDFDDTYDKVEPPKLEWYKLTKADPNFKTSEENFLVNYKSKNPVTVKDIVRWKAEEYRKSLEQKDQYQLLAEIRQRFEKEPKRFPHWLQYMVVHFSGMRYASAHGSWADPKDLLVQLRLDDVQKELLTLTDADVAAKCQEKLKQYDPANAGVRPKLAAATEKVWKDRVAMHMTGIRANGPQSRRNGLNGLTAEEVRYEFMSMTTDQALARLEAMKPQFPSWAWKLIVRVTPLRVNYVTDMAWEKLTPEEDAARARKESGSLNKIISDWLTKHTVGWREEHGRAHELIVSRAVCNETAEHVQHIRGNLPPGGLTPKAGWYVKLEKENSGAYYVKPKSAADYTPGASILWLRFVTSEPNAWQVAKPIATKDGEGLLPKEFLGNRPQKKDAPAPWAYRMGEVTVRTRSYLDANKQKVSQTQWLRWIHEATVAEVAETADGAYVYTFETSLPDDDRGTSCLGLFRNTLTWNLSDGAEDTYNRSFVGYTPEGQLRLDKLNVMLDWNKIILK